MGGLEEALLRPPVLPQQDRRIAGQGVEKAQVVGVQIAQVLHPVVEAVQVLLQNGQIGGVPGMLVEQPEHSGEKRGGPLEVLMLRRVD